MKNHDAPFAFSTTNLKKVKEILTHYPDERKKSAVLPLLDIAQRQSGGWLPVPAMDYVAHLLEMPPIRVYEVASFYTMFQLKPVGKYHLQFCRTTPCWLRGGEDVMHACQSKLGIAEGETTKDGLFTLTTTECLGACVMAPIVQVNDDYIEDCTPTKFTRFLDDLAAGKPLSSFSCEGRKSSAPAKKRAIGEKK